MGCLPCLGPHDCGVQCRSDLSLPRACVLFLSVPLPGTQVLTWQLLFLSYPVTCGSFLQPCWPRSLFASLWFFFSENSSICRWIFNVFVGGGALHLLLLCQLNLKPLFMCFILLLLLLFFCLPWAKTELKAMVKNFPKATKDPPDLQSNIVFRLINFVSLTYITFVCLLLKARPSIG